MRDYPIVYFYSGKVLPKYARKSIAHATRTWGDKVSLLTDVDHSDLGARVEVIDYRGWFDPSEFESAVRSHRLDSGFRGGFWSRTLLRFFVLEQFMKLHSVERLLHLELDSVLFITKQEFEGLSLDAEGLYIPWAPGSLAIGSFVYINNHNSLSSLVEFAATGPRFENEMQLLTNFLEQRPQYARGLPTADQMMNRFRDFKPMNSIPPGDSEFVFDANRLGMWTYGTDPKNTKGLFSFNHFAEPRLSSIPKLGCTTSGLPTIVNREGGPPKRIANVHMHSKRVAQAIRPLERLLWFQIANLPFKVIVGLNVRRRLAPPVKSFIKLVDKTLYRAFQTYSRRL